MEEIIKQTSTPEEDGKEAALWQDETILEFLDSLDTYLTLFDSLSSTLRQGWLELASARHSMGPLRISSALFDLNPHSAATTLQVNELIGESFSDSGETPGAQPCFTLSKWGSQEECKCSSVEAVTNGGLQKQSKVSQLRHRRFSEVKETCSAEDGSIPTIDNQVQKERSKSMVVFGTLVSPNLRAAQVSFETALDAIVKIANARSSLLSNFTELQHEKQGPN